MGISGFYFRRNGGESGTPFGKVGENVGECREIPGNSGERQICRDISEKMWEKKGKI